jgi:hypothetical protein
MSKKIILKNSYKRILEVSDDAKQITRPDSNTKFPKRKEVAGCNVRSI